MIQRLHHVLLTEELLLILSKKYRYVSFLLEQKKPPFSAQYDYPNYDSTCIRDPSYCKHHFLNYAKIFFFRSKYQQKLSSNSSTSLTTT